MSNDKKQDDVKWVEAKTGINVQVPTPMLHAGVVGTLLGVVSVALTSQVAGLLVFFPTLFVLTAYVYVVWNRHKNKGR